MADQTQSSQAVNAVAPAPGANETTTPEAAKARLEELHSDRDWVKARMTLGPDSKHAHEEDALQRIVAGARPNPTTAGAGELTPEQARSRLAELKSDPAWRSKFFAGSRAEKNEFDRLTQLGAQPGTTANPDDPATEKPDLSVYHLPHGVRVGESEEAVQNFNASREMAAEHGLSPGSYTTIVEQQVADEKRFATMTPDEVGVSLRADLQKMWGADYDHQVKNIQRYLRENPNLEEQLQRLIGYGPDRASIVNKVVYMELSILAAKKYGLPVKHR